MPDKQYPWKRYWVPRGDTLTLADNGYLPDSEALGGSFFNPRVVEFASFSHLPCIIFLGEPGSGKSHSTQAECSQLRQAGLPTVFVDLRAFGSEERLARLFAEEDVLQQWKNNGYRLHLFLDSLDECLLQIRNVSALLAEQLAKLPRERLFLRIASRTADWPLGLEEDLKKLWGEKGVGVYELAPLCQKDVEIATRINGIDASSFLGETGRKGVVPLAIRPVTLDTNVVAYICT